MEYLDHDPDQATEDQLRQYLLFVTEKRGWSSSTVNVTLQALKLIEKPSMRCFFTVVYALGLRLLQALNLQVADIDSKRMMVHVHRGKQAKDRMIPLPEMALFALRPLWVTHRNPRWIFPAEGRNHKLACANRSSR
jgi:integrase